MVIKIDYMAILLKAEMYNHCMHMLVGRKGEVIPVIVTLRIFHHSSSSVREFRMLKTITFTVAR